MNSFVSCSMLVHIFFSELSQEYPCLFTLRHCIKAILNLCMNEWRNHFFLQKKYKSVNATCIVSVCQLTKYTNSERSRKTFSVSHVTPYCNATCSGTCIPASSKCYTIHGYIEFCLDWVYQELIERIIEHATPINPNKMAKSKHGRHDYLHKVSIKRFLKRNPPPVGMVQCMNACTG